MPAKPPSLPFNAPAAPARGGGVMAMIVDLQLGCFGGMDPAVTHDYLGHVAQALEALRERTIPVCWLTMAEHSRLYPPKDLSPAAPRTMQELEDLDFYGLHHDNDSRDIYMDFLARHGPRSDEAVFCKYFFDAFTDMRGHPDARKLWDTHKNIRPEEYQQSFKHMNTVLQGPPFIEFMREQGTKHIISFGGISTNCVFETALGAARHGIRGTICTDLLVSLNDSSRVMPPSWYEEEMTDRLETRVQNAALIEKLDFTTFSDCLYTLSEPEPESRITHSRPGGPKAP